MDPVELPLFLTREEPILGRFTSRELGLVAGSCLVGLLLVVLDPAPLALTLPLAVALAGLSALQAAIVHHGHRPAWWLAHWLAFWAGPRTWIWRRPAAPAPGATSLLGAFVAVAPTDLEPAWLASPRAGRS